MTALHADGRIASRDEQTRGQVDLGRGLPSPHGHGLNLVGVLRIGREVEPRAGQVLDIRGDALAVDAVHKEPQGLRHLDRAAELHAPSQQRGVVARAEVVEVHVAHDARSPDVTVAVGAPGILEVGREIGNALFQRREIVVVGAADRGHLGRNAELEVVVGEGVFVADHRGEVEVIGVGTLEVDGRRGCRKVAEGRHVATQRKAQERHVGRTQAGRVAALGASAEVGVHEHDHAAQRTGVGDGLHKQTRGRSVHHQLLPGIVIAVNGNVVGHEVDVVDDAVEVIPGAEADETAQREGETVVLRGEDELRFLDLLEARTVGLDVVLRGVVHGHAVEHRRLLHRIRPVVVDGVHLLHRDQVDRRRIFAAHGPALVTLRRRGTCKQQSHD